MNLPSLTASVGTIILRYIMHDSSPGISGSLPGFGCTCRNTGKYPGFSFQISDVQPSRILLSSDSDGQAAPAGNIRRQIEPSMMRRQIANDILPDIANKRSRIPKGACRITDKFQRIKFSS